MNKELSDAAWRVLPSEFKEEVKKEWKTANNEERLSHDAFLRGCYSTMRLLFGLHNLTSDAEGEEMLTVSRKRVQDAYLNCDRYFCYEGMLEHLFGSKCLPDEGTDCTPVEVGVAENATTSNVDSLEPKPSEPKFKEGDIVRYRYDGKLYTVVCKTGKYYYALRQSYGAVMIHDELESDLEPYTEPEETFTDNRKSQCESQYVNLSQDFANCDKCLKSVQKTHPDFGHSRLTIAAMAMQGMLSNTTRFSSYEISDLVRISLNCADALIKEVEKGGDE